MPNFGRFTFILATNRSTTVVSQLTTFAHTLHTFKQSVHRVVSNETYSTDTSTKLPDNFKDFATIYTGDKRPSDALFSHCHRELFHEQWKVLLDDEFLHAYEHGVVITCCDGIKRRFYPRIFTYSADYPEK